MTNTIFKLSQILESAEKLPSQSDLFLPKNERLSKDTKCAVLIDDDNFEFTEETLSFAETHGLNRHFGIELVQDFVANAKLQKSVLSVEELVTALEYYLEYDAFYDFGNV
jgi:hypothetical protein